MVSSKLFVSLFLCCVVASLVNLGDCSSLGNHKSSAKQASNKRAYMHALVDDVNRCIMACGECSGDLDLPDDKDPEQTLSLVCANRCMENAEPLSLLQHLLSKDLINKSFAKCFLHTMASQD